MRSTVLQVSIDYKEECFENKFVDNRERRNFIKTSILLGIGASLQAKAGIFDELTKSDKNNPLNLDPLDAFLKSNPKYASCSGPKKGEFMEGCCELVSGNWTCYDKK